MSLNIFLLPVQVSKEEAVTFKFEMHINMWQVYSSSHRAVCPNVTILVVNNLEFGTEFSHQKEKYSFLLQ